MIIDPPFLTAITSAHDKSSRTPPTGSPTKTLPPRAVSEAIETRAHTDILTGLGCDLAQGYYLAHPMDPEALEDILHTGFTGALPPLLLTSPPASELRG